MLRLKLGNLFDELAQIIPDGLTIVEAGAFCGNDTVHMAKAWPGSTIYAFEPIIDLFAQLMANTTGYEQIIPIRAALADRIGNATFWPSEDPTKPGKHAQAGSLLKPKERLSWSEIKFNEPFNIETTTLNNWAEEEKIEQIDFLWLDLQGYELPVLQGASKLLDRISFIYMEVHFVEAYAGQKLYPEVVAWLEKHNFEVIGKDFDDTKSWFFGNILCRRKCAINKLSD